MPQPLLHRTPPVADRVKKAGIVESPFGVRFGDDQLKRAGKLKPWETPGPHLLKGVARRLAEKEKKKAHALLLASKGKSGAPKKEKLAAAAVAPLTPEQKKRTVHVGSVPLAWKKNNLIKALEITAGDVEKVRFKNLPIDPKYRHLGYVAINKKLFTGNKSVKDAFVTLRSGDYMSKVLSCNGKRVEVMGLPEPFRLTVSTVSVNKQYSLWGTKATVFVGNLHLHAMESHLWDSFEDVLGAGSVKNVRVMRDKVSYASKCCGFVHLKDKRTARAALEKMAGVRIKDRPIYVTEALPEEEAKEQDAKRARRVEKQAERFEKYQARRKLRNAPPPPPPKKKKEKHAKRRALAAEKAAVRSSLSK